MKCYLKNIVAILALLFYPLSAYAVMDAVIEQIASDMNIIIYVILGVLALVMLIFKSIRGLMLSFIIGSFAAYMFFTILRLLAVIDI